MKWNIIPQKFVADSMLGKFAKKLRLLGVDIKFFPDIEDSQLIKIALSERRILISSDRALCKRKIIRGMCFHLKNENLEEEIEIFLKEFKNTIEIKPFSRCMICNSPLINIQKENVIHLVPPYVYKNHDNFKKCPTCNRIYWKGTHMEKMEDFLEKILKNLKS